MPVYQYEGVHYDLPDGLTNEQAIAKIEAHLGKTPALVKQEESAPAPNEQPSIMQAMFGLGSPIARVAKGAVVDPLLGINQMLANTGLFGKTVQQGANQNVASYEQATQQARANLGSEGFDPYQLLGNVVSPANKLAITPKSATIAGNVLNSLSTGAGLAAIQPVTSPDYLKEKTDQIVMGAALGPLTQYGVQGIGALGDKLKTTFSGMTEAGRTTAMQEYLKKLSGDKYDDVISALKDARELVTGSKPTVAEAIANVPTAAELAAAQAKLAGKTGLVGKFAERTAEQQAARVRAIDAIAGTEAERAAMEAARNAQTSAQREAALAQADLVRNSANTLEKQALAQAGKIAKADAEQSAGTGLSYEAGHRAEQRVGMIPDLIKHQVQTLEESGFYPVRATDITSNIDKLLKGEISDQSRAVLQGIRDKILSKADNNGFLSSEDLYTNVRKTLNQDIAALLNQGEKFAQGGLPQQAAKSAANIKSLIDASLDKSSDGLWSKYINNYKTYSEKMNRMEVGNYLSKQLQTPLDKERAGVFATAVENAANTIKKSTGMPRYENLSDVLTPKETASVNAVLYDLTRASKAAQLSKLGGATSEGLVNPAQATPGLLSRTVTLAKEALDFMHRGNQQKFNEKMAELMLNPADMATFMTKNVPKGRINEFTSSLFKLMDEPTKRAFVQSFTVPSSASSTGQE